MNELSVKICFINDILEMFLESQDLPEGVYALALEASNKLFEAQELCEGYAQ